MIKYFIIIGGGPAGYAAALAAALARGASVVLVEPVALGGTCTNRGCIPTKFLLSRSEGLAGTAGTNTGWGRLVAHKDALVRGLARSMEARCVSAGVTVVRGRARLAGPDAVSVETGGGKAETYQAARILIASGSEPAAIPGCEPDGETVITSTEALDLKTLPREMIIVGSGAVGSEFAFIFNRMGVAVTLVEALDRIFPQEDPEVDSLFRKVYERMGVRVISGDSVRRIERSAGAAVVTLESGLTVGAEKVLVGVGRRLATGELGCGEIGVALGARGEVLVDDDLMSTVPGIYAAGDVTGRMLLAHVATSQGEHAARRALGLPSKPLSYRSVPWATYTVPEVASVGLTSLGAARAGVDHVSANAPVMENVKARIDRNAEGFIKVVAERSTGVVIGGTVVCGHAADLIHIIAMAVSKSMNVTELSDFCFGHPTLSESFHDVFVQLKNSL